MKRYIFTLACLLLSIGTWAQKVAKIGETEYETLAEAVAAVPTDGTATTITMLANVDLAAAVTTTLGQNIILDLNGKTIASTKTAISNKGNLEVTGTGNITVTGTTKTAYGISNSGGAALTNRANLVIGKNVTITAPCDAVYTKYGKTTINGTLANTLDGANNSYSTLAQSDGSEVVVAETAKITGVVNAIYGSKGTLEVNSTNVGKIYADGSGTSGLNIKKTTAIESLDIVGLAEFSDVEDYYVAAKAISACTGTVKLISDVNGALSVSAGKTVTLDLNGHKVSAETYPIKVEGNLTITGDGTVQSTGMGSSTTVQAAAYVLKNGNLTILSGNYVAGYEGAEGNPAVYVRDNAIVEIKGGDFVGGSKFLLNKLDASRETSVIKVTGGTFHNNFNPADNVAEGEHTNFVADGYKSVDNGDGTFSIKEYVAQIGGNKYESLAEAITESQNGETITLLANVTDNITIPADKEITLDLKGKTLSGGSVASNGNKAAIVNNGTITIQDSSAEQTGTIKREDDDTDLSASKSYYVIDNQGTMTIKSGTITNNAGLTTSHKGSSLIRNGEVAEGAVLNIEGGTLTQDNFDVIKNGGNNSVLNITGGTIKSANSYAVLSYDEVNMSAGTVTGKVCLRSYDNDYAEANLTGGTINGDITVETYPGNTPTTISECNISGDAVINGTLSVGEGNGNTFTANDEKGTIAVSGGTFANPVPEKYCADGYIPTANNDGKYGVKPGSYVAQIDDVKYESLSEAVVAATDGEASTITLLTDVIENITIPAGKNITLDLNGKTLNGKQTASKPTIKNLGTLTVKNGNIRRSGEGSASYYVIENEGTITMDEGLNVEGSANASLIRNNAATAQMTFNAGTYTQTGAFIVVKNDLGNVVINGGTFSTATDKNVLNNWDQMTINGGTFTGNIFNGAYDTDNNKLTINNGTFNTSQIRTYLGNGKTSCPIEIKGGTFTNAQMKYVGTGNKESDTDVQVAVSGGTFANPVPEKYCATGFIPNDNADGTYGVKEGSYIARIGEQGYETLTAAIEAAQSGSVITILADAVSTIDLPADVTINADNKVVTLPTFTVIDGEPAVYPNITNATSYRVKKATYIRENVPSWGTICLPFNLYPTDDIKYYTFGSISGDKLNVNELATDYVGAGVPVLFKKTTPNLVIEEQNVEIAVSLTKEPATGIQLVGTYENKEIKENLSSIYYINGDKFHQAKVSLTVPAYRAYINNTTAGSAKPRTLSIVVNGTENTTDIKTVKTTTTTPKANKTVNSTSEEQLDIVEVYDATGRKIPSTRKGLNLVKLSNGKVVKLFVK